MCNETAICVICQEEIVNNESYLPCNHKFHSQCMFDYIDNKIKSQADIYCPICRCNHYKSDSNVYTYLHDIVVQRKEEAKRVVHFEQHQIATKIVCVYPVDIERCEEISNIKRGFKKFAKIFNNLVR